MSDLKWVYKKLRFQITIGTITQAWMLGWYIVDLTIYANYNDEKQLNMFNTHNSDTIHNAYKLHFTAWWSRLIISIFILKSFHCFDA